MDCWVTTLGPILLPTIGSKSLRILVFEELGLSGKMLMKTWDLSSVILQLSSERVWRDFS
jgi:hypothetical protein